MLVCLGLLCSTVCITVGTPRVRPRFTPRFSAPSYLDSRYYTDNIFYNSGFGMPNCTAYAWGRATEILGKTPNLSTGNARDWYSYNKNVGAYDYGTTPKIGAIACFDNPYGGHVAVVENIKNGEITFSNSAYGGKNFYLTTASVDDKNPGQSGWMFQGYIYLGDFTTQNYSLNAYVRVVADSGLNLRRYAGINADVMSVIPENSQIFVTDVYECDGYRWGYTHFGETYGYCVLDYTENL